MAIVEDTGFLERFLKVRAALPTLEQIVLIDPSDLAGDDIIRYEDLAAFEPADLAAEAETATLDDLATIIYTSGTTGPPKGVMLSHSNVLWTLESVGQIMRDQTSITDFAGKRHVSYLPMAHIMERLLGHYYLVDFATLVACCPQTSQMAATAREVHPNLFIGVPRVWEKLYAGVNGALAADAEKKQAFDEAIEAALPIMEKITRGTATDEERATWDFLDEVAFKGVRALLGLDQTEIAITGAAPIPSEILAWFRAIGVPLTEGYGLSETMAVLTWSLDAETWLCRYRGGGRRDEDRRRRRSPRARRQHVRRLSGPAGEDGRDARRRRLVAHRRHRRDRRRRVPEDHRPQEGTDHHRRRQEHQPGQPRSGVEDDPVGRPGVRRRREAPVRRRAGRARSRRLERRGRLRTV